MHRIFISPEDYPNTDHSVAVMTINLSRIDFGRLSLPKLDADLDSVTKLTLAPTHRYQINPLRGPSTPEYSSTSILIGPSGNQIYQYAAALYEIFDSHFTGMNESFTLTNNFYACLGNFGTFSKQPLNPTISSYIHGIIEKAKARLEKKYSDRDRDLANCLEGADW